MGTKKKSEPKAKKPAKKRKTKPASQCKNELVTIKVTPAELQMIFARADRFADGNVSRLLRHAAQACKTKAPKLLAKPA